jgi:hypothetical protein
MGWQFIHVGKISIVRHRLAKQDFIEADEERFPPIGILLRTGGWSDDERGHCHIDILS